MHVHFGVEHLQAEWLQAVGCIGTFDGVHLGHRTIISETVRQARETGKPAVLLTFDRHPLTVLAPERAPLAISSVEQNLAMFESLGIDLALILPFTQQLSDTSADSFFEGVIRRAARIDEIVVGHDFCFGHGREGTPEWLAARIPTEILPPHLMNAERVSSSAIRRAIATGAVEQAAQWLSRPFAIPGIVVRGEQLGRTMGYPTANLARSFSQVTPADGIYAGDLILEGQSYRAAISIGMRPAVGGTSRTIEAFLLDYKGDDFYGEAVSLSVETRIREERNFDSLEALKAQIAEDVKIVRG